MNIVLFEKDENPIRLAASDYRFRHIRDVLKLKEGETFTAGITGGKKGRAHILKMTGSGAELRFAPETDGIYSIPLELLAGHPRPPAARRIMKDAAAAGIRRISFFIADNSEKSYIYSSLWKGGEFRKSLLEGAEQGGHCFIPDVQVYPSLAGYFRKNSSDCEKKICFEFSDSRKFPQEMMKGSSFLLAVGPERGWTGQEVSLLSANGFQFSGLGDTILRTETACTAAAAIVSALNNFFRG